MTSHGYGGTDRVEGKGERRLCVCGWKAGWGNRKQVEYEWKRHIDAAAGTVHYEPPSMQELLVRKATQPGTDSPSTKGRNE